jgi:acetoin utilization deacetylase AcuC-like enzyme
LQALRATLPRLLAEQQPGLVLYNAGADVAAGDALGKMALSDAGIAARDRYVMACCAEAGVPIAAAIGGGYAEDHSSIVERHVQLHRAAAEHWGALAAAAERRRAAAQQARRPREKL